MDDFTIARVLHVVAIIFWIGGVGFVTTVLIPALRRDRSSSERLAAFHAVEKGFAWQARLWVGVAGLSGFWMVYRGDLWSRFLDARFWWMHAMVALWVVFAAMLYFIEPLFLHRRMEMSADPARDFSAMERMHRVLFLAGLITAAGAMAGAHGLI